MADWVDLPGRLDSAGLRELYRHADAYLAPVVLEAFSIAVLEAQAAGLAVVVRSQSGAAERLTHGVDALLARRRRRPRGRRRAAGPGARTAGGDHGAQPGDAPAVRLGGRAGADRRRVRRGRRAAGLTGWSAPDGAHSHSMVPGGLDVMSSTTRFTSGTALVMRVEIRARTS